MTKITQEVQKMEKQVKGRRDYLDQSDEVGQEVLENVEGCWKVKGRGFSPKRHQEGDEKLKRKWIGARVLTAPKTGSGRPMKGTGPSYVIPYRMDRLILEIELPVGTLQRTEHPMYEIRLYSLPCLKILYISTTGKSQSKEKAKVHQRHNHYENQRLTNVISHANCLPIV